jgi:cysteine-rich repeat protein
VKRAVLVAAMLLVTGCELFLDSHHREDTAQNCGNGIDDDGNGQIDCADPACRNVPACAQSQSCGNGQVDPGESCDIAIAAGAAGACPTTCDDQNSCTSDQLTGAGTCFGTCEHSPTDNCCGNGRLESGEACDDGNQLDYDGCSQQCEFERALVISDVQWLPDGVGCDLTGDAVIDNAIGRAMGQAGIAELSNYVTQQISGCRHPLTLLSLVGIDFTMTNAPFRASFLLGLDTDKPINTDNNFMGYQTFWVSPLGLDARGTPLGSLDGAAPGGMLQTTQGHAVFWSPCITTGGVPSPFVVELASLSGTIRLDLGAMSSGTVRLCAAVRASSLHGFASALPDRASLLDILIIGYDAIGIHVTPTQPDIDVDGDGLETFTDTDLDNQVDLCTDGNGAMVAGVDCPADPRFADGYSAALQLQAVRAFLAGRQP